MSFQEHFLAIRELNTTLVTSALPTAPKFNLTDPTSYQSHRWSHAQNKVRARTQGPNAARSGVKGLCPGITCNTAGDPWRTMSALVLHWQWERMLWMPHKCQGSQAQLQEWGQDPGGERGIHLSQLHTMD